ncbi:MAG: glutathione S-transferase family protein [Proteobacteria bacterium]|nr:glutathione S-transferase family protein [Pseudomonadota bacterium]
MTIRLHYHPLSSFCWKVLIALYELDVPFEPVLVDLSREEDRTAFYKLWPMGKFPVIEDTARDWMVPESSIIIEYLDQHYSGPSRLIPADPDKARQVRMRDRFFDLHIHQHMQKVVGDRLRPADGKDPIGVQQARDQIRLAYGLVESDIGAQWVMGDSFTMADCAAAPALFYGNKIAPLASDLPKTAAYLERLKQRPSFARVLKEAEPYFAMFPG